MGLKFSGASGADLSQIGGAGAGAIEKIGGVRFGEDLTTYTETDPNSRITVAASKITGAALTRNEAARVSYDFGADYFNAIYIQCAAKLTASVGLGSVISVICVTNNEIIPNDATTDINVALSEPADGTYRVYLARGPFTASAYQDISIDTLYYLTLRRAAASDTIYLDIHSDAARTSLVKTISISGIGTETRYRYAMAASTYHDDAPDTGSLSSYSEGFVIY